MKYINYFIKCVIRKFVNLIFKPKMFLLLLVVGFVFSALLCNTTFAAVPPDASYEEIYTEYLDDRIIGGTINKNSPQGVIETFGGSRIYFARIDYKGQKVGATLDSYRQIEARIGFFEYPAVGTTGYYVQQKTSINNSIEFEPVASPISKGFVIVTVYHQDDVDDISIYTTDTNQDALNSLGSTITQNQDKNTQDIIDNNDENTDKIIASNNNLNNALTNSTVTDSSISINTSDFVVDSAETVALDNFFSSFMNNIKDIFTNIDNSVEEIEIGIPYTRSINYITK